MAREEAAFSSSRPSMEYLRHFGPHDTVAGDLTEIGMRGIVFAPNTGPRCPAVVFGHGYLQPARRYADTLRYLASWGFVAAAPDTERGPLPSHSGLALDMSCALDRLADAKLNNGRVTVDERRLATAGHGIGGGAAVLAAAMGKPAVQAVATVFATETAPSAVAAAAQVAVPGLHLVAGAEDLLSNSEGDAIARAWRGPAQLRSVKGARHLSVAEGKHQTSRLLGAKPSRAVLRTVRQLLAAFLLVNLADQSQLGHELDGSISGTTLVELAAAAPAT